MKTPALAKTADSSGSPEIDTGDSEEDPCGVPTDAAGTVPIKERQGRFILCLPSVCKCKVDL